MINPALSISIIVIAVLFAAYVVRLILKDRMRLRYSLLWFLLVLVVIGCAVWPGPLFALSEFLGFRAPANFIFLVGIALILLLVLSLSITVSWQSTYIRSLVQEMALLKDALGIDDARQTNSNDTLGVDDTHQTNNGNALGIDDTPKTNSEEEPE